MLKSLTQNKFVLFFIYFIAFQPILDILTTFSVMTLNTSATAGVLIRFIYMAFCVLFLLSQYKKSHFAKYAIHYLALWFIFIIVNLGINVSAKPTFDFFEEIKFFAKITYFNVIMIHFIYLFKLFAGKVELTTIFMRNIMISGIIIGLVMYISIMTGTSLDSYKSAKIGYSGWFYAGNEIGATIAIIFPLIVYYAIVKTQNVRGLIFWIPVVLSGYALIMIGTKVGYGALLITILVAFISLIIAFFLKKTQFGNIRLNALMMLLCIITLALVTPISPLVHNTQIHIERLEVPEQDETNLDVTDPYKNGEVNKVEDLILSGRQLFFSQHTDYYEKASMKQKLFGMGYASNYSDQPKTIEIDYFDLFFSTGIIGSILYFLPLLYFAIRSIGHTCKSLSQILLPKDALLILSIVLGLGIAGFAGHVFTAPSVSIYLCAIIAYFYVHKQTDLSTSFSKQGGNTL